MQTAEDFVEFLVRPVGKAKTGSAFIRIRLKQPIVLYDETRHSPFVGARAVAKRRGREELGLHPCANVTAEPHDWSDGVDELSANSTSVARLEIAAATPTFGGGIKPYPKLLNDVRTVIALAKQLPA